MPIRQSLAARPEYLDLLFQRLDLLVNLLHGLFDMVIGLLQQRSGFAGV
jgi:hypothetical protein